VFHPPNKTRPTSLLLIYHIIMSAPCVLTRWFLIDLEMLSLRGLGRDITDVTCRFAFEEMHRLKYIELGGDTSVNNTLSTLLQQANHLTVLLHKYDIVFGALLDYSERKITPACTNERSWLQSKFPSVRERRQNTEYSLFSAAFVLPARTLEIRIIIE